jgi:hypothetical protein
MSVEVPRHQTWPQPFHTMPPIAGKRIPLIVFWPVSYFDAASVVMAFLGFAFLKGGMTA